MLTDKKKNLPQTKTPTHDNFRKWRKATDKFQQLS